MATPGIFISYRHVSEARAVAIMLHDYLTRHFPNADVFHDGTSIQMGERWPAKVAQRLAESEVVIALIHRDWDRMKDPHGLKIRLDYEDDWIRQELCTALVSKKTVIPVLLDGAERPDRNLLHSSLHEILDCQETRFRLADAENDRRAIAQRIANVLPSVGENERPMPTTIQLEDVVDVQIAADLIAEAANDRHVLFAIAETQREHGRQRLAELLYAKGTQNTEISEKSEPDEEQDSFTLSLRFHEASTILNQGRFQESETLLSKIATAQSRVLGPNHPQTLATRYNHARAILRQTRPGEAMALLYQLLSDQIQVFGEKNIEVLATWHAYGSAILRAGQSKEAETEFRQLLAAAEKAGGRDSFFQMVERYIAWAQMEQGNSEYSRSLILSEAKPMGSTAALELMLRGWLADYDGDGTQAQTYLQRAEKLLNDNTPLHHLCDNLARYRETRIPGKPGGTMIRPPRLPKSDN